MMEEESGLAGALKTGAGWRPSPPARLSLSSKQVCLLSFTAPRTSSGCLELAPLGAHSQGPWFPPEKCHRLPSPALLTWDCTGDLGSERGQSWREERWAPVLGLTFLKEGMSLHFLQLCPCRD